ncbi:hypothetical protein QP162_03705 [Sphingomonas aurantiaca]|uniref:hypothetical protein n=1 Tax=Sphingomonas aurantiaca TaxID=185949 RepID=UPI002FE259A1
MRVEQVLEAGPQRRQRLGVLGVDRIDLREQRTLLRVFVEDELGDVHDRPSEWVRTVNRA